MIGAIRYNRVRQLAEPTNLSSIIALPSNSLYYVLFLYFLALYDGCEERCNWRSTIAQHATASIGRRAEETRQVPVYQTHWSI